LLVLKDYLGWSAFEFIALRVQNSLFFDSLSIGTTSMLRFSALSRRARLLAGSASLVAGMFAATSFVDAALVVDLRFADGSTTKDYSTWNPATDRVEVWAKVIGTNTTINEGLRSVTGALYTTTGAGGSAVNGGAGFGVTNVLPSAPFTLGIPQSGSESTTGARATSNTANPLSTDNLQDWGSVSTHVVRGGANGFNLLAGSNTNSADPANLTSNSVISFISGLTSAGTADAALSGAPRINPGSAFAGTASSAGIVLGTNARYVNAAGTFLPDATGATGVAFLVGLVAFDGNGLSASGAGKTTTLNWQRFTGANLNNAQVLVDGTNVTGVNNTTLGYTVGSSVTFTQPVAASNPTLTVTPTTPISFNVMLNGTLTGAPGVGTTVTTDTAATNVIATPSVALTGQVSATGAASIAAAGNYVSQVTFTGPTASAGSATGTVTWSADSSVNNAPANQRTVNVTVGNAGYGSGDTSSTTFSTAPTFQSFVSAGATVTNLSTSTNHAGAVASVGNTKAATTATILNYRNTEGGNAAETIGMQWRTRTAGESNPLGTDFLLSDVVKLSGMGAGPDVGTFVLTMDYNFGAGGLNVAGLNELAIATSGELKLAWRNGSGQWVNAIAGNVGGTGSFVLGAVQPNAPLGTWGVDTGASGTDGVGTVWAVLNHNSEFAVIPEPSTMVLGAVSALGLGFVGLRRRRAKQA
jgi:hypothetical protein